VTNQVERLCDRVASSTLLEDRRDAVRALKSLSKKFRLEVGTQGMDLLINVMQTDRNDTEITGLALQTLGNLLSSEPQGKLKKWKKIMSLMSISSISLSIIFMINLSIQYFIGG